MKLSKMEFEMVYIIPSWADGEWIRVGEWYGSEGEVIVEGEGQ